MHSFLSLFINRDLAQLLIYNTNTCYLKDAMLILCWSLAVLVFPVDVFTHFFKTCYYVLRQLALHSSIMNHNWTLHFKLNCFEIKL